MNVYIVLYTLSVGGAERHATSIANYLSLHGYHVKMILLQNHTVDYALEDGIEVIALSDLEYPNSIAKAKPNILDKVLLKIYRLVSEDRYNLLDRKLYIDMQYTRKLKYYSSKQKDIAKSIVISFMPIPNIAAASLKKKYKYSLILGEFNSPHLEFAEKAPENTLKRIYFPNADGFVFQTDEQKGFYHYLSTVKKVVIPNPLESIHVEPFQGQRKKEIVNFCRHVKAKNLPLLIEAFSKLVQEYPDYTLVIYGDGPEKNSTERCVREHGIEEKVILKPYALNVLESIRESAMFVSSSDREGISNSMVEAMAIGLPTICTDCPAGGARMFIKSYINGILVPVQNPEALYRAMKFVIENPENAAMMSENAVEIRNILNKDKIMRQWLEFIRGIGGEM
ncbi:MAG: glycosyltransferase [Candidatus Ventricola sp.]